MAHILLVNDDIKHCELLTKTLSAEGYLVSYLHDGENALNYMKKFPVDLVLLDLISTYPDGLQVARRICQRFATPIIMISPLSDQSSLLDALQAGADQYLLKPFKVAELLARITSILRRVGLERQRLILGNCDADFSLKISRLPLTETEVALIDYLVRRGNSIVSKETLQKEVLKKDLCVFDRNLDMHISNIRRKMLQSGLSKQHIKTIRGQGYIFYEKVA